MNWKLPSVLTNPSSLFKGSKETQQPSGSDLVNDLDDDLGVNRIEEKRDVPFLRMESAVRRLNIAMPVDLERLGKHKVNIINWRSSGESLKLQLEYENSSRTVRQITRNLKEMDTLRARVLENELDLFDHHIVPTKTKALHAIEDFLSLRERAEEILTTKVSLLPDSSSNVGVEGIDDRSHGCHHRKESLVTVQGNQLLIGTWAEEEDSITSDVQHHENVPILEQQLETHLPEQDSGVNDSWSKLERDITDLHEMMHAVASIVNEQGEMVDDISSNVETANDNIKEGTSQLKKATILKAAMFPLIGAAVGGAIGGPIGMVAGIKLGSMTTGIAAAGFTGSVIGYQGGKALKKRHNEANSFEMKEIKNNDDSDGSTGSFEFLDNDEPGT